MIGLPCKKYQMIICIIACIIIIIYVNTTNNDKYNTIYHICNYTYIYNIPTVISGARPACSQRSVGTPACACKQRIYYIISYYIIL